MVFVVPIRPDLLGFEVKIQPVPMSVAKNLSSQCDREKGLLDIDLHESGDVYGDKFGYCVHLELPLCTEFYTRKEPNPE